MEIVVDRIGSYARLALALLVVLSPLPAAALGRSARQQAGNLTVITQNDKDLPVAGVHVRCPCRQPDRAHRYRRQRRSKVQRLDGRLI
jgi:hypothetical protein